MNKFAIIVTAGACAGLIASAVSAAPAPSPEELMRIVFPGWSESGPGRVQTATARREEHSWGTGKPKHVVIEPRLVLRTAPDRVTLIAAMLPEGENFNPEVDHSTALGMSAYQFRQAEGRWITTGRQEGFAYRGFFGEAKLRAVPLSDRLPGLSVETGSCWFGYCGSWMTLYAFDDAMVAPTPVAEFTLSGSNLYSSTDCQERLRPLVTAPPGDNVRDETEKPETHDCYSIDTSWSIAPSSSALPGELTLRYRGAISRAAQHPGAPVAIDQRQVLRYTDGQYRVINGENPIPAI